MRRPWTSFLDTPELNKACRVEQGRDGSDPSQGGNGLGLKKGTEKEKQDSS